MSQRLFDFTAKDPCPAPHPPLSPSEESDYRWLIQTPASDGNFLSALSRAAPQVLQRVLAESRGREGHKGRCSAIERRLKQLGR